MKLKKNNSLLYGLELIITLILFCVFAPISSASIEVEKVKNFAYTGKEQTFTAPVSGYYRLETWGAQGGSSAGYGAYSTGVVYLDKGQTLYINVGENPGSRYAGGYNGGGNGGNACSKGGCQFGYGGGGATHIAKISGVLSSLVSNPTSVLIVAAGGGNTSQSVGSQGGGIQGKNGYDTYPDTLGYNGYSGYGATTNANGSGSPGYSIKGGANCGRGAFGRGGNFCTNDQLGGHGGGGGWYGGGASNRSHGGGGGGSSYIGSSSLISYKDITKSTYCIDCTTSNATNTLTISVSSTSESPIEKTAKEGHGYAKTTLVANDDGRLETLKFSKGSIVPTFNSDTYSYSITLDSESSFVDISAIPLFKESTIKGTGKIGISKGTNDIYVTSTSEAGTVFTYTIHTTRSPSSYKYLNDIKIFGESIKDFKPEKTTYEINVPYNQEVLELEIEKGRYSQEVYLPSNFNLHTGQNKFEITVVSEDGSSTIVYELNVNREHSSKLKSLTVNNFELDPVFNPDTLSYTLKIMANTMSVNVSALAFDEEATIKLEGFGYIKSSSTGKITVTEPNSKTTVYEIYLEKQSSDLVLNFDYPYTGDIETFTAPANGYYRLETWGSQGGGNGGFGAYSTGVVYLKEGTKLYITVGGQGDTTKGGYNGGGTPGHSSQWGHGGGGATHISTIPSLLSNLASDREAILIVAAGGGGGGSSLTTNLNGHAGGYLGNNGYDTYTSGYNGYNGTGASLSSGGYCPTGNNSNCGRGYFGRGGNFCNMTYGGTGGGAGYFGGGGGNRGHGAGGGGSSYVGSPTLISYDTVTKSTYCYGCATSSAESTKTISTNNVSSSPTRNYAKKGAGYARISTLRFPSENNFLSSLNITATNEVTKETNIKNYTPTFDLETTEYSVTLDELETSITFLAKAEDNFAKIDGLGTFTVPAGTTDFPIKVMAESGSIRTIIVHVTRPASKNALPINIEVNGLVDSLCSKNPNFCVLNPVNFDPDTKTYEVTVPSNIKQVWFTVTKGHPFQTVTGSGKVSLNPGENDIVITVTSEDGSESTEYHYLITRSMAGNTDLAKLEILDPAREINFNPSITEYYFSVPNEYTQIKQMNIETEDPDAEYFVSGNQDFKVGLNEVTITVTSPNGETGIYTLKVYREKSENVYLSNLEVKKDAITYELLPQFQNINTGTYQITVPNNIDSVNIIATPEVSTTKITGDGTKNLTVGINHFQIITTSETGTTETYYLEITREKNNNTNLLDITVTNGDTNYSLDPEFNPSTTTYSVNVLEGVSEITITATPEVNTTTYKLLDNNKLKVGENLKRIMVIAEDGSSKIYNVVINRPANDDNYLENILLSNGTLTPEFDREKTKYTVEVPYEISSLTVTGVKSNPLSKISGNGTYALAIGNNNISLSVISETGNIKLYELEVIRKPSDNAYLSLVTTTEGVWVPNPNHEEFTYTLTVPSNTSKISIMATPEMKTTKVMGNGEYELTESTTEITITTIAGDNKTTLTYTITIEKEKSANNNLKYLLLEEGEITPEFQKDTTSYTASVPYEVEQGTFHVESEDSSAKIEIIGNESFQVGENTVTIRVTSESGIPKDYTVVITRQEDVSGSDYLATLTTSTGTLDPSFQKEQQYYEMEVPYTTSSISIDATPEDPEAVISGKGDYTLTTGKNTILIRVLSTEGKIRDYQIVVTRKESDDARLKNLSLIDDMLSPNFQKDTFNYTTTTTKKELDFDNIIPVEEKATYQIIGNNFTENKTYQVIIRVTAPDGLTTKDYTINVTKNPNKNNNLESLKVLGYEITPEFNKGITLYTLTVPNDINSVMIEAIPESNTASVTGDGTKALNVGVNQLIIEVTSEAGTKKAYTIMLTKEESSINNLANLIVHNGTMTPEFNTHISTYDVVVENEEEELDLTVILESDASTYEVKNNHLEVGDNTVEIVVTAEDGTQNTITLNVTRKSISSALLEDLKVKNYPFEFNSYINHYDLLINYETDVLDLTIIPKDKNATYIINGNENLVVGDNTITIEVTASDGITKETYTLNVKKQKYATTFLDYLYTSEGDVTPDFEKKTLEYSLDVANNIRTIEIFGESSDATATVTGLGEYDLNVGENKIVITVTSTSGVIRKYYITVNRAPNDGKSLENLVVRSGMTVYDLDPEFDPDATEYHVTVPIGTSNVTIDASVTEPTTVTGSGEKELHAGVNDFTLVVTSEAGESKTITIHITREASDNNHLISLIPSIGTLEPSFSYEGDAYTINLDSSASLLSFDVITEQEFAKVSGVDAEVVPDGTSTRLIVIEAENGDTRTITITVNKKREDNALLSHLEVTGYPFEETFDPSTFTYHITVPNDKKVLSSSEVLATPQDESATINKGSNVVLSTTEDNEFLITVTAKDGFTKQTYKIIVTREKGSNALLENLEVKQGKLEINFDPETFTYNWMIPNSMTVTITDILPTPKDPNATYEIKEEENKYVIKVISEDESTSNEYILNITIDDNFDLEQIIPEESSIMIDVDETQKIDYILIPGNTSFTEVSWVSDDETIAKVDSNGNITGVGYGTTKVHIVSIYDETIECSIEVKVIRKKIMSSVYTIKREEQEDGSKLEYTYGSEPSTIIKDYLSNFDNDIESLHVYDSEGNEVDKETGITSTFMKIKLIIEGEEYDGLTIVVKGDLTGDGEVTGPDNVKLQNYMLLKIEFNEIEKIAADVTEDDEVTGPDNVKLQNYMLLKINTLN